MSMVERQTEDALDKATDNMFSRPSIDAGIKPTRRELKEVCVFIFTCLIYCLCIEIV